MLILYLSTGFGSARINTCNYCCMMSTFKLIQFAGRLATPALPCMSATSGLPVPVLPPLGTASSLSQSHLPRESSQGAGSPGDPKYVADAKEIARILASDSDYSCFKVAFLQGNLFFRLSAYPSIWFKLILTPPIFMNTILLPVPVPGNGDSNSH